MGEAVDGELEFQIDMTGIVAGESFSCALVDTIGADVPIEAAFDTDPSTTAANLAASMAAVTGWAASAVGPVISLTSFGASDYFLRLHSLAGFRPVLTEVTADLAYDTILDLTLLDGADFYAVLTDSQSAANVLSVATWVNTEKKVYFPGPLVSQGSDYDATGQSLKATTNVRTASLVHRGAGAYNPAAAWVGDVIVNDPGEATWAYKAPAGVAADPWSTGDLTNIEASNSNHATSVASRTITRQGITHGGQYIDITRGLDWLENEIQVQVFALLANAKKVPYTDVGIALVRNRLQGALTTAEQRGVLSPGDTLITVPTAASADPIDKGNRLLRDVKFSGVLQGAIHKVRVEGTVSF
jgi:hypothetical protein